jgi:hypothetical protein
MAWHCFANSLASLPGSGFPAEGQFKAWDGHNPGMTPTPGMRSTT